MLVSLYMTEVQTVQYFYSTFLIQNLYLNENSVNQR